MCGIDGFFSLEHSISARRFYDAHSLIAHRGPDDEGFVGEAGSGPVYCRGDDTIEELAAAPDVRNLGQCRVILGHRRLAIIDLSPGGHQPMCSADGRYWIVYNGEVYNYVELRQELEALGVAFEGTSDTEVVLAAWMQWGPACLNRFNGMWAFAIWDVVEDTLLLARDRFGIKPLFYARTSRGLFFASEMKFIRACADTTFQPNAAAVDDYVMTSRVFSGEETVWEGIQEVPPAHYLTVDSGGVSAISYWSLEPNVEIANLEDAKATLGELLDDSLRLRLRSDVRVGSLLSGGLDSSVIVAELHRLGLLGSGTFATFSAVSRDERYSELRFVEEMARAFPVEKHLVELDDQTLDDHFDDVLDHIEVPFRSLAVFAQYLLYRKIRDETDVTVLLNGQGGDELFGGYLANYYTRFGILYRRGQWVRLASEVIALSRARDLSLRRSLSEAKAAATDAHDGWNHFNQVTFNQIKTTALREYLAYDDRNSMAFSREARVPFLDYRIVEFAFSLHPNLKINGLENKRVVREWSKGLVPESIRVRRDKMGFTTPQEQWQRGALGAAMERDLAGIENHPLLGLVSDPAAVTARVRDYFAGSTRDWAFAWRVYCLSRWLERVGVS